VLAPLLLPCCSFGAFLTLQYPPEHVAPAYLADQFITACKYVAPTRTDVFPTFTDCVRATAPPPQFEYAAGIAISDNTLFITNLYYSGPAQQVLSSCTVSGTSITNCGWQTNPVQGSSPGYVYEPYDVATYGDYAIIPR